MAFSLLYVRPPGERYRHHGRCSDPVRPSIDPTPPGVRQQLEEAPQAAVPQPWFLRPRLNDIVDLGDIRLRQGETGSV